MYRVIDVPVGAAESTEQLGTKFKFWYSDSEYGMTLFKEGRPGHGENWAEKIACELAGLLSLPHAHYELARFKDMAGVISPSLVARGARLIHGNELLATFSTDYAIDSANNYKRSDHTLRRVLGYFRRSSDQVGARIRQFRARLDPHHGLRSGQRAKKLFVARRIKRCARIKLHHVGKDTPPNVRAARAGLGIRLQHPRRNHQTLNFAEICSGISGKPRPGSRTPGA